MNFNNIDRRIIYLLVALALMIPILTKYSVKPAPMESSDKLYQTVERVSVGPSSVAFVALDFGANTIAENGAQAQVTIEHLMRRRIPIALMTLYQQATPYLTSIPEKVAARLMAEGKGQVWEYGKDWVNLGYSPGGFIVLQSLAKSEDIRTVFKKDVRGNNLSDIPAFRNVRTIKDIVFLGEFTGLTGIFNVYVQFFQSKDYRPAFGHGCTSITVPEGYIYMDSGQLDGLLEGLAGAAWYSELLNKHYPNRAKDPVVVLNTSLGVAHLVIIALIIFGNLVGLLTRRRVQA